ncbi:MAG: ABC transporter substrate binding protein, partial [Nitrospiria bacterium]
WILPDGSFVDNVTIDYFIRYSLKEKVPLIGFSEGLARSGALISISGNNKKMGEKAVEVMDRVLAGKQKERIEFLKDIKTYLNTRVAELFDISINKTFYALVDRKFPEE